MAPTTRKKKLKPISAFESIEDSWLDNFYKLQKIKEETGSCQVSFVGKSRCLANWISRQRYCKLTKAKREMLDSIDFPWETDSRMKEGQWECLFQRLKDFKEKEGHCLVSQYYELDIELGNWVCNQRKRRKLGKMPPERMQKLDEVGFVWSLRKQLPPRGERSKKFDERWNEMFQRLVEFKKEHGHCDVASTHSDRKLASWVGVQRTVYHALKQDVGKKTPIKVERIAALQNLGFTWQRVNYRGKEKADRTKKNEPEAATSDTSDGDHNKNTKDEDHHERSDDGASMKDDDPQELQCTDVAAV